MENVTIWELRRDIKDMAASCVGLSVKTARKKADNLFNKYSDLMHVSSYIKMQDEKRLNSLSEENKCLKTGVLRYSSNKNKGVVKLADIVQVEVKETQVVVLMKTGKELFLSLDFDFLIDIL